MNILQISVNDYGGCAYYLAEAINATYPDDHASTSVRSAPPSYINYKTHSMSPQPADLTALWNWSDVVHIHDVCPPLARGLPTKPTVVTYHGSMYRRNPRVYNDLVQRFGWVGTVATVDLTAHGLEWMPDCRPSLTAYANRPDGRFIVAHAPTSRAVKDTNRVIEALDGREGIALDVIERVDYETCLRRKGYASLYVDQFRLCYGLNAVEAWSMGIPVVANAGDGTKAALRDLMGELPFVETALDTLLEVVLELRDNPALYAEALAAGQRCYQRFHCQQAAAQRALAYYERALGRGKPRAMPVAKAPPQPTPLLAQRPIQARSARPTPMSRRQAQAKAGGVQYVPAPVVQIAPEVGEVGMVVLRYAGNNVGLQKVTGDVSGQVYTYSALTEQTRCFLADIRDAEALTNPRRRGLNAKGRSGGVVDFEVVG